MPMRWEVEKKAAGQADGTVQMPQPGTVQQPGAQVPQGAAGGTMEAGLETLAAGGNTQAKRALDGGSDAAASDETEDEDGALFKVGDSVRPKNGKGSTWQVTSVETKGGKNFYHGKVTTKGATKGASASGYEDELELSKE